MLRDYEILYIVRPELDDEQLQLAVSSVDKLIDNLGGTKQKTDIWGRRRLAYEVKHLREGQYVLTDFQLEPVRVPEMEATLKISDNVFRHLIVRKPEIKRAAKGTKQEAQPDAAADAAGSPAETGHEPELEPAATAATEEEDEE